MKRWAVVTSGPSPNSLGVVRGLARQGIPVALVDLAPDSPVRFSRLVRARLRGCGSEVSPQEFVARLADFARSQPEKPVLIATGDREALIVSRNLEVLRNHYLILSSEPSVVEPLLNKALFARMLQKFSIPHPATQHVPNLDELEGVIVQQRLPFILKPTASEEFTRRFHQKLFVVRSEEQVRKALAVLQSWPCEMMIQELIPAAYHHEVYALRTRDTGILALCGWDRLRQFPPGFGAASFCRTRKRDEALLETVRLLDRLDYEGIVAVEFICDERDRQLKVLEVNPRTSLQNRLAAAAGVDIEYLLYQMLSEKGSEQLLSFREDLCWVDDLKDSLSRIIEFRSGRYGLGQAAADAMTRKLHSLYCWHDPVPWAVSFTQAVRKSRGWLETRRLAQ